MKKIISISMCLLFVLSLLGGCKNNNDLDNLTHKSAQDTSLNMQSTAQESTIDTRREHILTLLNSMVFHDINITFPCKASSFTGNFTLENGFYFAEEDYTYYELMYQDDKAASIGIAGKESDHNDDRDVVMMIIEDEQLAALSVGGKRCDTDVDGMIDIFGTPDKRSFGEWKSSIMYDIDSVDITIIFDSDRAHEITIVKKG